jgi:hypothetical protein
MPKFTAAKKPVIDQTKGTSRITNGIFLSRNNRMPKVKIVVGHGSPNVGENGYKCPNKNPNRGYTTSEKKINRAPSHPYLSNRNW